MLKFLGRNALSAMWRLSCLLRPWSVRVLGDTLGVAFYYVSSRYRNVAIDNLKAAYGDQMSEQQVRSTAKRVFRHFARGLFEFFYLTSLRPDQLDQLADIEGEENARSVLSEGKGCITITAHYGNWELMARKMVLRGYKVNVIARDSDDPGMTGIGRKLRESGGYKVYDKDQPLIGAFRALKRNEILAILPDQNDSTGIFVDFFGRPASTATGPAVLSLRSGAPLVPCFCARDSNGKYKVTIHPRIQFESTGDEQADVHELTALITAAIEQEIRLHPEQWLWLHDRWKRLREVKPDGH